MDGVKNKAKAGVETKVDNSFALGLYAKLKDEKGNIFFSPASVSTALAMVYEGARGETAEEIRSTFNYSEHNEERRDYFRCMMERLNKKEEYDITIANALWAQKDFGLLKDYTDIVDRHYGGKVTSVDFIKDTENTRQTINNWVENKTNDKIKNLLSKDSVNGSTRLVLTNAIYFKGDWEKQFDKDLTREEEFRTESEKVNTPMMRHEKSQKFRYGETEEYQILELPYKGGELSMLLILPKDGYFEMVESSLTEDNLEAWQQGMSYGEVIVEMPKFKTETEYEMRGTLSAMGMPMAFSEVADFSGITGDRDLEISGVIHKAFVDVNEEGTEAAAATGVVMRSFSISRPKVFRADHPFIYAIQEKNSNILFMGRVVSPTV